MLTRELMGVLALAILWLNTLLVVGAAWGPMRELLARLRDLRASLREGEVVKGDADGVLARHTIEQVGRRASDDHDRRAIVFHDRAHTSLVTGGVVRVGEEDVYVDPAAACEVWVAPAERDRAAACPSRDTFGEAYAQASKAKGFERAVASEVRVGARVWLGTVDGRVLVATLDPARACRARVALLAAFMLGMLALGALVTFLALYPPLFGTVSIAGGVLGLVFFLLVQPAGVMARDAVLLPSRAHLRGNWIDVSAASDRAGSS